MEYAFDRDHHDLSEWRSIIRKMQSVLDGTIRGIYDEAELGAYIACAIRDARPVNGGLFWGFDDPGNMPGDARCDFFYRPSYIMTLTLTNAVLRFPGLLDIARCRETLHGALIGCTGRGLMGHGYDGCAELYDNLKRFLKGNILAFLAAHPDIGREFAAMLDGIMKEIRAAYMAGDHFGDWDRDFKAEQEEVLGLYPAIGLTPGHSLYFAYGSNMDEAQMAYRCPGAKVLAKVTVPDHRFALDEAGVATILPSKGDHVEGLLWSVTHEDEKSLDRYEGVAAGCYRKEMLPIDDHAPGCVALVYLSNRDLTPRRERSGYMERIIQAARDHRFTEPYIQMLQTFCPGSERA
ncbi:MAG: gamma-glutamylcyclotransferase [Clostridia bacterium]|nr:gamma-glutamylcyclotransferase [Clostridia bacterium]